MLTPEVHELPRRRDTHVRDDFVTARAATTIDADGTLIIAATDAVCTRVPAADEPYLPVGLDD